MLLFQTPLIWWLASPLRVAHPPQPADAIVVFAGGVGESGKAIPTAFSEASTYCKPAKLHCWF